MTSERLRYKTKYHIGSPNNCPIYQTKQNSNWIRKKVFISKSFMIGLIIEFHKLSRLDNQISVTCILIATNYYACGNIYRREIIWTSYFCFYAQYQWNNSSNHQYDECQILASLPQEHLQDADVKNEVHLSANVNKK